MISFDTTKGLINGVYYFNNVGFGMRAAEEHRNMRRSQFVFKTTHDGKNILEFNGTTNKQSQGGRKTLKETPKQCELYLTSDERCPGKLYKKYIEMLNRDCPDTDTFYQNHILSTIHQPSGVAGVSKESIKAGEV